METKTLYDIIHPFKLAENKYVFFDIFHKNNEIILICPVYNADYNYKLIQLKHNNNTLKLSKIILKIESEPIVILKFSFVSNEKINTIVVLYNNMQKKYTLVNKKTKKTYLLTQTTLFKNDYKLIDIFYKYYKDQGVEKFYLYYNGKINNNIKNICEKEGILLLEWDYKYWNTTLENSEFRHHAQLGQIHHSLYKYGKDETAYMIFNDLDEYMFVKNIKLCDLVRPMKFDTYGFCNYWANTIDKKIPEEFPNKFMISDKFEFGVRSKCIHKVDSIYATGIHTGRKYTKKTTFINKNNKFMMFHFFNWSGKKRTIETKNKMTLQ